MKRSKVLGAYYPTSLVGASDNLKRDFGFASLSAVIAKASRGYPLNQLKSWHILPIDIHHLVKHIGRSHPHTIVTIQRPIYHKTLFGLAMLCGVQDLVQIALIVTIDARLNLIHHAPEPSPLTASLGHLLADRLRNFLAGWQAHTHEKQACPSCAYHRHE